MADFTIKRNDRRPVLEAELLYSDTEEPVDLTGATLKFFMQSIATGSTVVSGVASLVGSATLGMVRYSWGSGTTATSGAYRGEFQADYGGGITITGPNSGYITINIIDDLG